MAKIVIGLRLGSMRQRTLTASAVAFVLGLVISLAWSLVEGYGF